MCRRVRLTAQLAAEPRKHLVTGNELNFTALDLSYAASDHDPPRFVNSCFGLAIEWLSPCSSRSAIVRAPRMWRPIVEGNLRAALTLANRKARTNDLCRCSTLV